MALTMALAITLAGAIVRSGSGEAEARSDARRHDELCAGLREPTGTGMLP